jgi:4-hydroxybenzoate polyprenyltransferase
LNHAARIRQDAPVIAAVKTAHTDIRSGDWIDRFVPQPVRPYLRLMRLDRPIGIWLLLFPGWWSIALAAQSGGWPDPRLMALFAIGAVVMRGAGCTFNDIVDRKMDARVARTAGRPIPSGAVSARRAAAFLLLQLVVALAVLLAFNRFAIALGAASLVLVAVYPFMKRITWWPQLFLGITFNWGALMGWAAATGRIDPPAVALYGAGIVWTLLYDTIYAHQDVEDDAIVGIKSTARLFGSGSRTWLAAFAAVTIFLFALAVALDGLGWPAWFAVVLAGSNLAWQVVTVNLKDPADCLTEFRANRWIGWILLAGIVLAHL